MENMSMTFANFLLIGIEEMKGYEYLYGSVSLVTYVFIMFFSINIVLVVLTDPSLHKPMYILICNLILNGIFGSTSFFPKLIIDLFSSYKMISRVGCFIQTLCVQTFDLFEISTFTIMAYDRYLAVCHPLQYCTLMTNKKVLRLIVGSLVYSFMANLIGVLLSSTLPLCGTHIKNIFCDNMAIVKLSCFDTSMNNIYGATIMTIMLVFTLLIIGYSYKNIFVVCLTVSKDDSHKAIHTLATHILCFSIFLIGVLFVFIRYRLNANTPLIVHILLSANPLVSSPIFNPLIYGIRTKALRMRMIRQIHKISLYL
ncbi:olfactory receptor 52P1-like [Discoglossus pictus]